MLVAAAAACDAGTEPLRARADGGVASPGEDASAVADDAADTDDHALVIDTGAPDAASGGLDAPSSSDVASEAEDAPAPVDARTTLTFTSGTDWSWVTDGGTLSSPALVCLDPGSPPVCPAGAVMYMPSGGADTWPVSYPGASWIWRGDVALSSPADLQPAVFEKTFVLGAHPTGTISITADDFAQVVVNGAVVGSTGSTTDESASAAQFHSMTQMTLDAYLVAGKNTIRIEARNGPAAFTNGLCSPCTYAGNPAGVLFGGTITSG
jgi:hypothetical protein